MVGLARGYAEIVRIRDSAAPKRQPFYAFLGFDTEPAFLDDRLLTPEPFEDGPTFRPAHEYAGFIRKELLEVPGPLIDRLTVAARLGIDVDRSKDFEQLLSEHFSVAEYKGPLREGWPRWWAHDIEEIWLQVVGSEMALRATPAGDRVRRIRSETNVRGLVASEARAGASDRFWVACQVTGQPLDPRDGFILRTRRRYNWQDNEYVSLTAIVQDRLRQHGLHLDPREERRAKLARNRATE
jgi:hypothetical protein